MTVTLNDMEAQLKTLVSAQNYQARKKRKFYCWSCGRNFTHGRKTWSATKAGHQEEAYYRKSMGGSEKGCEWRLGTIDNKIKISNSKISLIDHIDTPPNPSSTNMLAIADSGENIHLSRQATPTMDPLIMENEIKARLPDGSTMELTHIATLQIPSLSRVARYIHILSKIQTAPLISLGVLCDDGCTITLDK